MMDEKVRVSTGGSKAEALIPPEDVSQWPEGLREDGARGGGEGG